MKVGIEGYQEIQWDDQNQLADNWQSKNPREPHWEYQPSKHQHIDPSSKNDAN